jgi:hypothetical protein
MLLRVLGRSGRWIVNEAVPCSVPHLKEPLQHGGGPLRKDFAEHLATLELVLADHGAVPELPAAVDCERQPAGLASLPLEANRSVGIDPDRRQPMAGSQAEQALGLRKGGRRRPGPAAGLDQGLCLIKGLGKEWVHQGIVCRPPRGAVFMRHLAQEPDDNCCFIQYALNPEIDMRNAQHRFNHRPNTLRVPRSALHRWTWF